MTLVRRALGIVAIAAAARWSIAAWRTRPRYAVDAETGDELGLRISPLRPAERTAAVALERRLHALGFDNRAGAGVPSGQPVAAVVPNHGGPPASSLLGGTMEPTGPHERPPDRVLPVPFENPTAAAPTPRIVVDEELVRWRQERSGAVQTRSGLTLSEANGDLGPELEALRRIRAELVELRDQATAAYAAHLEPAFLDARDGLADAIAVVVDITERLASRDVLPAREVERRTRPPGGCGCLEEHVDVAPETALEARARDGDR